MIPHLFPELWNKIKTAPPHMRGELRINAREVRSAFARLISDPKLYEDRCFCFFIDGLDEHEGSHQEDIAFLVHQLRSWTTASPDNIKLCVSSREYRVFTNAFPAGNGSRINLHQLTRSDIAHYTSDKLGHMGCEDKKARLIDAIVENANGIFLWAILVTKRVRERIEDGASASDLFQEIGILLQELDGLFAHLLNSLPKSDMKKAYQVFSMLLFFRKRCSFSWTRLRLLPLSFLENYNRDSLFAEREDFLLNGLGSEELAARVVSATKLIRGCCRGFVDVVGDAFSYGKPYRIDFTHRSVPEFMLAEAREQRMQHVLNGFDVLNAVSQLILAEALADPGCCTYPLLWPNLSELVAWRADRSMDTTLLS